MQKNIVTGYARHALHSALQFLNEGPFCRQRQSESCPTTDDDNSCSESGEEMRSSASEGGASYLPDSCRTTEDDNSCSEFDEETKSSASVGGSSHLPESVDSNMVGEVSDACPSRESSEAAFRRRYSFDAGLMHYDKICGARKVMRWLRDRRGIA